MNIEKMIRSSSKGVKMNIKLCECCGSAMNYCSSIKLYICGACKARSL